jgi:hypothetical protein
MLSRKFMLFLHPFSRRVQSLFNVFEYKLLSLNSLIDFQGNWRCKATQQNKMGKSQCQPKMMRRWINVDNGGIFGGYGRGDTALPRNGPLRGESEWNGMDWA